MRKHLEALARNEISFDRFAILTTNDWTRLAGKLYMQWRKNIPRGVELEDVKQEMLLNAWIAVGKWDKSRGMSLRGYVVCRAWQEGVRFIHVQRSALRRSDKAESRHPVSFSEILKNSENDWTECLLSDELIEGGADDLVDTSIRFKNAMNMAEGIDLYALVALKMSLGHLPAAGDLLFDDAQLRLQSRWGSPSAAVRQIEKTLCAYCA